MKQMFHGKCTFSQTLDFFKFSGGAWIPCLCYLHVVASFCIFLHVTLGLVSYYTENFQSVEYCMAISLTTC